MKILVNNTGFIENSALVCSHLLIMRDGVPSHAPSDGESVSNITIANTRFARTKEEWFGRAWYAGGLMVFAVDMPPTAELNVLLDHVIFEDLNAGSLMGLMYYFNRRDVNPSTFRAVGTRFVNNKANGGISFLGGWVETFEHSVAFALGYESADAPKVTELVQLTMESCGAEEGLGSRGEGTLSVGHGAVSTRVIDSTFKSNRAAQGSAIAFYASGVLHIERCSFISNVATVQGGAILLAGTGTHLFRDSLFYANAVHAPEGTEAPYTVSVHTGITGAGTLVSAVW